MRRQPAQAIALAAVALVAIVGMLAFVIDVGFLFMARGEAQAAADAAALAGVRELQLMDDCKADDVNQSGRDCWTYVQSYASANYPILNRVCSGNPSVAAKAGDLLNPGEKVRFLAVTVECPARLTFGRILWDPGDPHSNMTIRANAVAAIGNAVMVNGVWTGEIRDFEPNPVGQISSVDLTGSKIFLQSALSTSTSPVGLEFEVTSGNALGQSRPIQSYTPQPGAYEIDVLPPFSTLPSSGSQFIVRMHKVRLISVPLPGF